MTAMQRLASRLWPHGLHPGGLGWAAAIDQLAERVAVAEDPGFLGWAGVSDDELQIQADPSSPDAARALIEWSIGTAGGTELAVVVADGDHRLQTDLTGAGFERRPERGPVLGMERHVRLVDDTLPEGYRIRPVHNGEFAERVAVHRAAWRPASMPWPSDILATVPAAATSRFTGAHYERVRGTWLYDPTLDLVVETSDGTLAACCIAWWDPASRWAEIEPLGVAPEHRRRGLASAMCLEVAGLVAARGGQGVFINTGPRADYPAPASTYASVGFVTVERGWYYSRRL